MMIPLLFKELYLQKRTNQYRIFLEPEPVPAENGRELESVPAVQKKTKISQNSTSKSVPESNRGPETGVGKVSTSNTSEKPLNLFSFMLSPDYSSISSMSG